ncbi:MAG TPA: hypothetical protein VKX49_07465 [Bryobacteraceae bacterium]|nr:hypothetical protein [Bryobacteraceae bacterium]
MTRLWNAGLKLKIWNDSRGQDLLEYALAAGFIAVAAVAASPALGGPIWSVFGKVAAELQLLGGGSSAPSN